MRVSVVVCVLALLALVCGASALHPDVALLSEAEQASLSRAMASWPADEIMPLLAADDMSAFDDQRDHVLMEADSEMEAEVDAEADSELDAELDADADMDLDSELDSELDAEAEEELYEGSHLEATARAEVTDELLEQLMSGDASGIDEAILAEVTALAGQSVAGQAKGGNCGSGWSVKVVPDYNMGPACAVHDRCYAICGTKQTTCDTQFLNNMRKICSNKYPSKGLAVKLRLCNTQANVYYQAVKRLGASSFKKGQTKACPKGRRILV